MRTQPKILSIKELSDRLEALRRGGKKIVHCHGCFDLMHPGHVRHFQAAKEFGDVLVVTVTPDRFVDKGPGRPVFNEVLRAESIAALECVDFVALNEWPTAERTIELLRPTYYVKGQEFEGKEDVTGKLQHEMAALQRVGAASRFTHDLIFSSSQLVNNYFGGVSDDMRQFLLSFKTRFSVEKVLEELDRVKTLRILVIGDTIIDDYHYCRPLNMASKSMAIAAKYLGEQVGLGGSLCVANHLASFCDHVTLMCDFGTKDTYLDFARAHLRESIRFMPIVREGGFTTLKKRFIEKVFFHKIFEIQYSDDTPLQQPTLNMFCSRLQQLLPDCDVVIVADFGHGLVGKPIIEILTESTKFLAISAQTNSANLGFNYITKYPRADYVAIDERELRLATHDRWGMVDQLSRDIREHLACQQLAVTLGRDGALLVTDQGQMRIPIVTNRVVDSVGAGDAFLSLTAPLAYLEAPPELTLLLGNLAGGMAANIIGNSDFIRKEELSKWLRTLMK